MSRLRPLLAYGILNRHGHARSRGRASARQGKAPLVPRITKRDSIVGAETDDFIRVSLKLLYKYTYGVRILANRRVAYLKMKKYTSAVRSTSKKDFGKKTALQAVCNTSIARVGVCIPS